jgi:release factor glutamine methyltransferase
MSTVTKAIYAVALRPFIRFYLRLEPTVTIGGLRVKVARTVFHPKLFFSSGYLREFVSKLQVRNKTLLEIGCGTGILSLTAAQSGAHVTATDINPAAVSSARENAAINSLSDRVQAIQSDVFDKVPRCEFDYIVVNPPYYFKTPNTIASHAWYCGENGEFFEKFFASLKRYSGKRSQIFMCLEEKCEIGKVKAIAATHGYRLDIVEQKKMKWEVTYIFGITLADQPSASGG